MLPARRLGVFVAYNTDSGAPARDQFFAAFVDHYFPRRLADEAPPPKEKLAGLERFHEFNDSEMYRCPALAGQSPGSG